MRIARPTARPRPARPRPAQPRPSAWALGLTLALTLGACGKQEGALPTASSASDKESKPRGETPQSPTVGAGRASGGGPTARRRSRSKAGVPGRWAADLDALHETAAFKDLPAERWAAAQELLSGISFEFTDDGDARVRLGGQLRVGTWSVNEVGGRQVLTTRTGEEGDQKVERFAIEVDAQRLRLSTLDGDDADRLILRRQ